MMRILRVPCCVLALAACGDDDKPGAEVDATTETETETEVQIDVETEVADTDASDATVPPETSTPDVADVEVVANEWGFPIRTPASHALTCDDPGDLDATDSDWLCTFVYAGQSATLYAFNTPTACDPEAFFPMPIFGAGDGWLSLGPNNLTQLADVSYDWGGNHHNDSLSFTYNGKKFSYYHSSFGFGFRTCQELDCLQVRALDNTLVEDGCTADRTLPVVCRKVTVDGTWGDFTDTFEKCNGDPNAR